MSRVYGNHKKPTFLNIHGKSPNEKKSMYVLSVRGGSTLLSEVERSSTSPLFSLAENIGENAQDEMYIQKRDGSVELLSEEKVRRKFSFKSNTFRWMKRTETTNICDINRSPIGWKNWHWV